MEQFKNSSKKLAADWILIRRSQQGRVAEGRTRSRDRKEVRRRAGRKSARTHGRPSGSVVRGGWPGQRRGGNGREGPDFRARVDADSWSSATAAAEAWTMSGRRLCRCMGTTRASPSSPRRTAGARRRACGGSRTGSWRRKAASAPRTPRKTAEMRTLAWPSSQLTSTFPASSYG